MAARKPAPSEHETFPKLEWTGISDYCKVQKCSLYIGFSFLSTNSCNALVLQCELCFMLSDSQVEPVSFESGSTLPLILTGLVLGLVLDWYCLVLEVRTWTGTGLVLEIAPV